MTMTSTGIDTTYNGWFNYETWNVALYIQNDEPLYQLARGCEDYEEFLDVSGLAGQKTPDGVSWNDWLLNVDELNEMIEEL
jgi:hypothetical protein